MIEYLQDKSMKVVENVKNNNALFFSLDKNVVIIKNINIIKHIDANANNTLN